MSENLLSPPLHVVAGVLCDAQGRVLLAQRSQGRDMAGLWEFPGGKLESGENAASALQRELREELGVEIGSGEFLIAVPQAMPHKRIVLEAHCIKQWQGQICGLEGQAVEWVWPEHLQQYPMPPADRPIVAALLQTEYCLVTPSPDVMRDSEWLAGVEAAVAAGVGRIQLRAPGCSPNRWRTLVAESVALAQSSDVQLSVNGEPALALQHHIGLHLPEKLLRARMTRDFPDGLALSASCHDEYALRHAEAIGCDYVVVGQIKPSPSHPGAPGIGWPGFSRLREVTSLPMYAIGGLNRRDLIQARRHGAQGIAAIRAFWPQ